jgi:hypothetical protein
VKTFTLKVTNEEALRIRSMASRENLSVSEYLRRRVVGKSARSRAPERIPCEFTGAMIFSPPPELPPIEVGTVREMLVDFP